MKCPKCGTEQPDSAVECRSCGIIMSRYQPRPTTPTPQQPSQPHIPLPLSTGAIPGDHEILGPVFLVKTVPQPAFGKLKEAEVLLNAADELRASGAKLGANAIAWTRFEVSTTTLVVEVFAYGTAVRTIQVARAGVA